MDVLAILIARIQQMAADFVRVLPQLAIAVLILLVTWFAAGVAARMVGRATTRAKMRPSLANLMQTLASVLMWIFGILIALTILLPGVTAGSLLAVLGLGSVAIGFAFKDIFENFLAGILIMLRKKMRIGDMIECEGLAGKVEHITLRETHLRLLSNEVTIVPNSFLFKNPVRIDTDEPINRYEVIVGVSYDTDLEQARGVIAEAAASADGIERDKAIEVYACEFNSSSIDFRVRWWSGSRPVDMHKSRDSIIRNIKRALDDAGIEIPFPYVTNTFKEPLRIAQDEEDEDEGGKFATG